MKRRYAIVTIIVLSSLFVTCQDLFQVGLGDSVDLEAPIVRLLAPESGMFLRETVTISGTATDDQSVAMVEISFDRGETWREVDEFDDSTAMWNHTFDTTQVPDGRLYITVRATDGSGKQTSTDDLLYNVDNTAPVVLVTSPERYDRLTFNTEVVVTVTAADIHTVEAFGAVVEKSSDDGETWEEVWTDTVEQSTTWTLVFRSGQFTVGQPEMLFRFIIWAEDEARNRSTEFYHIDHLKEAFPDRVWTADVLLRELSETSGSSVLGGGGGSLSSLTSPQRLRAQSVSTSSDSLRDLSIPSEDRALVFRFDEDGDIPVIEWIAPIAAEPGGIPGTGSQGLLAGLFRDDDGIDLDSAEIRIERSPDFSLGTYSSKQLEGEDALDEYIDSLNWQVIQDWVQPELVAQDIRSVSWDYRLPENAGQGYFRARLQAADIDGTLSRPYCQLFVISDGAPSVEIDSPDDINFSDRFVLTGQASAPSDDVGLEGVNIAIRDGSEGEGVWSFSELAADYNATTQNWTFDTADPVLDLSGLDDGSITVRATAFIGEASDVRQVTLVKDTVAPEAVINNPEAGTLLNRTAEFRGIASDSLSGVAGIEVRVAGSGSTVLADWTGFSTGASTLESDGFAFSGIPTNWTLKINTELFGDAPLELFVQATDRAGNQHETSRAFEIYQDSDLPVMTISNIDIDGGKFDNVLSGDPRLIGSVSDDDAVDPDSFRYRVWRTIDSSWSDWLPVYEPGERSVTPRLDFNIPLLNPDNPGQFLGDGSHLLQLWIEDVDGIGLTREEPGENDDIQNAPGVTLAFSVDKGAPSITIASPASNFVTNADFDIVGEATDGFGIERVEISFDGGDSYQDPPLYSFESNGEDPLTDVPIEYTVRVGDGGDVEDGSYNIRLRARDLSASEATENITVTIDTTPPTVEFIRPVDGSTVNAEVLVQGSANDNMQVDSVYWYITPENTAPPEDMAEWNLFPNRYSWEYTWDTYAWQADPENFDPAAYRFHVRARDTATNWGNTETLLLQVDQESDRPTLDISNLNVDGSGMPDPIGTVPENVFTAGALITGSVQDDDGITGSGITYRTRSWDWDADAGAGAYGDWSAADDADWTPVEDTFTGERTNATWSQSVSALGDGVHEIQFRVRDIHYDSERLLDVNFNWDTIGPVSFAINTANPQPAITAGLAPTGTSFLSDNTLFSGTAADAVGIHVVEASLVADADPETVIGLDVSGSYVDSVFTWDSTFPVAPGEPEQLADGDYTVTVTATDRLGRTGSMSRAVYVDTEAPTITVGNLADNDLITTEDFTVNGTADDGSGSGVAVIEYSLDDGTTWEEAAGTTRWSVALEALAESLDNSIQLRSADQAGNQSEPITINFRVDLNPPEISEFTFTGISTTGSQNYSNGEFGISFDAADTQGLKRVTVTRIGDAGTETVFSRDYAAGITSENIAVTQNDPNEIDNPLLYGTLAEGDYTYSIVVEDIANRFATLNRTVVVDRTPPDVEITNLRPVLEDEDGLRVNSTIEFSVAAGDASGLVNNGVKWWIIRNDAASGPPTGWADDRGTAFDASPYKAQFDTDSGTDSDDALMQDNAEYTLYIIARDRAGNETTVERAFLVDQESDFPTVIFTDVDPTITTSVGLQTALSEGNQDNLLELNARIRGTIEDDDRVDRDTIEIALNVTDPQDIDYQLVSTRGASGRSVSFSHNLIDAGLSDGVHFFYLRFSDDADAKLGDTLARTTTVGPVYFVIDTQNPELAITSPPTNSYLGSDFTIIGTASDASGIDRVEVSIDGGTNYFAASDTSAVEDPDYSTWSYDVSNEPDGVVTIQVRAFDAFDKTSSADRQINVDTEPPTVDIVEPIGGTTVNSTVRLRGSTFDNFTVDKSYYWIGEEGAAPPNVGTDLNEWTEFAGRYSWEYDWDTFAWQNTNQGNFDARDYTLHVIAQDSADNWSTVDSVTVTVDQESNKPIIEMTSIDAAATADSNLLPVNLRINGAVEDDDAVDRLSIQVRVENLSDQSEVFGWTSISGPPDSNSAFVSWSHTFREIDIDGNPTGAPTLTDGQYRLFVRAADINDGTYDQFTSSEIGPVEFAVDLSNPTGSVDYPDQGAFINDDTFEITGTAVDANGIKSVEILFDGEASPVAAVDASEIDPAYSTWEYTFNAVDFTEGQISFQVIITDTYDKVTTLGRSFTLDQTPPSVSYTEPAAGAVVNGSLLVRGTSDDDYGVASVSYAVQRLSVTADPVPVYPADYEPLSGTFSWDFRINTTELDDGDYRIYIVAADQAGNANADAPYTRDVTFDQSTNLPVITISNASADPSAPTLFGSGGAILGTITDDDGVDHTSIQIAFVDNPQEEDWIAVSDPPSSGGVSVNFSHTLAGVAESVDTYTVRVRASDIGETLYGVDAVTSVSQPVYIGVDRNNPAVALATLDIVDPYGGAERTGVPYSAGMLVNDDFTLRGTASDASGIVQVRVEVDGGAVDTATYSAGEWSYSVPVTRAAASDGPMTIVVEAEDGWGKITTRTYNIVIDTTEPLVTFTEPDFGSNVNGTINLRGNNSDANSIISLLLQLGLDVEGDAAKTPVELINTGTLLSWEASVDTSDYANADRGVETPGDSNVWFVPFVVTVEDAAGNRAEEERTLRVDPDSDKPIVAITGPEDGTSVPAEFVFQGTITDDDPPPMSVQLSADSNNDGEFDVDLGQITEITSGSWVKIVDTTDTGVFPEAPSGTIGLRAIPFDQYGTEGDADIHEVFVDTQAPIASIIFPETGDIVRGEITITGTFRDDQALAESQMRVSFDGGNTFTAIGDVVGSSITPDAGNPVDGEYLYDFSIPVDTTTQVDGGNGFLEIAVRVTDATFKQNTAFLDLSVDNTRPSMELNYDGTMEFFGSGGETVYTFDGNETEGGNYIVIGSATDAGTISGIERIDVYFVKNGAFLGVRDGVTPLAETTGSIHDQNSDLQVIPYRVPEPRESDGVLVDDYVISIDNRFERGIYDQDPEFGDDDGFQESLRTIGAIDEWYAYIDTTVLPDGPFTLYAVVYDLAGNTSFIEAAAQAANYPPSISRVQVGTRDLGSDGSLAKDQGAVNIVVEATDTVDPFGTQGIVVDSFKLTVAGQYAIGDGGAIGAEQAGFTSFFYGSQDGAEANFETRNPTTGFADTATVEKLIDTTSLASGYWYKFVAEAEDRDGNLASRDFYVWVNNDDDLPPVVTIDDFTQGSVSGLPGHVDLPGAANPALSGTVNITGTIYDDTSVESLTLEISPDDGTSWEILGTVTEFGDSILEDEDEDDFGVRFNWSYEWNTATIASVPGIAGAAQENLIIRAYGDDGTNLTPVEDRPQKDVDVVPYITNILTGFDAGLLAQARRSATGQYPVQVGQEITIVGYNMPGTVANSVSVGDTLLTPASADGTASVTVDLGVTDTSGELEVLTNEVASRNNTNDNAAPQNRESTQFNNNLTDDRVIAFWDLRSHATLNNKEDAVMRSSPITIDSPAGVDWLYTEGGNYLRYTDGALNGNAYMTDGFALRYGDFSYNDDGELLWVYLHNATWTALTEWGWYGSMQWGRSVIGTRDPENTEAYNWNIPETSRLGLGNMSFEGDVNFAYNDHQLHRYRNPRMVTQGGNAATDNLVAYRDISTSARGLVFYGFQTGTGVAAGTTLDNGWNANLSKTVNRTAALAAAGNNNQQETGILTPTDRRGRITGDTAAYFDLNVTPGGTAVAVWYDQGSGSLKFAYNESPMTTPDAWTERAQPITTEGGTHVTMEVDPVGGIHLAYLDTATGYLKYSYLPAYDTADGNIVSVFVDALFSSGQQNGITIRDFGTGDYRPVISTFSTTYSGTRGAVRAAWPETPLASLANGADPATGNYTGDWEVMTVPAATPAQTEATFVEVVDPAVNNRITVGYNGEYLEEATYLGWD